VGEGAGDVAKLHEGAGETVTYDIASPRRWRRVFRITEGYGEWVQLSVFQCRLTRRRHIELKLALEETINHAEDHVILLDLGPAEMLRPRIESLGNPSPWSNAAGNRVRCCAG
jgi:CRISPR-associated protein Cas2